LRQGPWKLLHNPNDQADARTRRNSRAVREFHSLLSLRAAENGLFAGENTVAFTKL
jgi:hypothetical protein